MRKNVEHLGTREAILSVKTFKIQGSIYSEPSVVCEQRSCPHSWVKGTQEQLSGEPGPKLSSQHDAPTSVLAFGPLGHLGKVNSSHFPFLATKFR